MAEPSVSALDVADGACTTHSIHRLTRSRLTDAYLETLGYKQELTRGMNFLGSVGVALGCMQPLLSAGVFQLGMLYGGPAVVVYGFLGCFVFSIPLVLSMAEISSPFTTAGGPYYWTGALAGRLGKLPPFVVGWVILVAFLGGIASTALQAMEQAVAMRMIWTYGFDTEAGTPTTTQLGQFGIAVSLLVVSAIVSLLPMRYINKLAYASFYWLLFAATLIIVCIPIIAPNGKRQTSKFVWRSNTIVANTQFNGIAQAGVGGIKWQEAFTVMNGLLMAQYLILVYDTPGHMAEETTNAAYTVPRAIMGSFFIGSAINLALLVAYLYSITNVKNVTVPGFGITGSCKTVSRSFGLMSDSSITPEMLSANASLYNLLPAADFNTLPPWTSNHLDYAGATLPNDGVPLNAGVGGCILSNGVPFSYFPVGNIFYDAFAARFPACPATSTCADIASDGRGCCDVTNTIRPTLRARDGAIFFVFLIFIGTCFAILHSFVAASRFIYSFARDGGFPGPMSRALKYVEPTTKAPLGAIVFFLCIGVAFVTAWTNESPTVAFAAVSGINANAFLMVYGIPSLLRFTSGLRTFTATKDFNLRWLSIPFAVIGASYGAFSNATIALPNLYPQGTNTINYAPIALAAIIALSMLFYPFANGMLIPKAAWYYKGPALIIPKVGEESVRMGDHQSAADGMKHKLDDVAQPVDSVPVLVSINQPVLRA